MASLDDLWSRFSLTEEEEQGADVPRCSVPVIYRLAARFLTKRTVNAEAVARTFKPLWKPSGKFKIRDIGGNILVFEFDDALDLERVLEHEPWSYDKSLVVFKRTVDVESAPLLEYTSSVFWVQLHNIPDKSLTQETGEVVGNTIGKLVQVADPEDDGQGCEFLWIRVSLDITKPLPRCCKLWSEGEHIGWALLKFERLPNFCYWCGRVNHSERDCDLWLQGKGKLKKENQQYGEWLRADPFKQNRKTVVVVSGRDRGDTMWRKGPAKQNHSSTAPSTNFQFGIDQPKEMMEGGDHFMEDMYNLENDDVGGVNDRLAVKCDIPKQQVPTPVDMFHGSMPTGIYSFSATKPILVDITNSEVIPNGARKWKKLAREAGSDNSSVEMSEQVDRRPTLDLADTSMAKRYVRMWGVWRIRKTFRWLLGSSITRSNELLKLELSWAWEPTDRGRVGCFD